MLDVQIDEPRMVQYSAIPISPVTAALGFHRNNYLFWTNQSPKDVFAVWNTSRVTLVRFRGKEQGPLIPFDFVYHVEINSLDRPQPQDSLEGSRTRTLQHQFLLP